MSTSSPSNAVVEPPLSQAVGYVVVVVIGLVIAAGDQPQESPVADSALTIHHSNDIRNEGDEKDCGRR